MIVSDGFANASTYFNFSLTNEGPTFSSDYIYSNKVFYYGRTINYVIDNLFSDSDGDDITIKAYTTY